MLPPVFPWSTSITGMHVQDMQGYVVGMHTRTGKKKSSQKDFIQIDGKEHVWLFLFYRIDKNVLMGPLQIEREKAVSYWLIQVDYYFLEAQSSKGWRTLQGFWEEAEQWNWSGEKR